MKQTLNYEHHPVEHKVVTLKANKHTYDVRIHKNTDGSWYSSVVEPGATTGRDTGIQESGSTELEVIESIRKRLDLIGA